MMRPTAAYKMSKSGKIALACAWNRAHRGAVRKAIIEGELYGRAVIKSRRDKDS